MPAWVFIEIVSFGEFLAFYKFCANRFALDPTEKKQILDDFYLMLSTKKIRNAAAHNSCIINDLRPGNAATPPNYGLIRAVRELGIGANSTRKKLSNERILQILNCMYTHNRLVSSPDVHHHLAIDLQHFSKRMFAHYTYESNPLIQSSFSIISTAIDKWYPVI